MPDNNYFSAYDGGHRVNRLQNGMVQIDSYDDEKKVNMMMAKTHAAFAKNAGEDLDIPMEMMDTRAMAEFYAELLSYGPSILKDAVH